MSLTYKEGDKLYVVVRSDLPSGVQLAQAIHAKDEFAMKYPETNRLWWEQSNYICVLQVANEEELLDLMDQAFYRGIKLAYFCEPDLDQKHTAVALEPSEATKELCKPLKLALA